MPRADPIQDNFIFGEINPLFKGQARSDFYKAGVDFLENYMVLPQGPVTRRMGSRFVAEVQNSTTATTLIPFIVSRDDAYMLEFSDLNIRFYKDHASIADPITPSVPLDITTPYSLNDIFDLKVAQKGDTMFIVHPLFGIRILTRLADNIWNFAPFTRLPDIVGGSTRSGPYLAPNVIDDGTLKTSLTLTSSSITGVTTITASVDFFVNTDAPDADNPGRQLRLKDPNSGSWTLVRITGVGTSTVATAIFEGPNLIDITPISIWAKGLYSRTTGFPRAIAIHQDRLILGGSPSFPQRFDASKSGAFEDFNFTKPDDTVDDDTSFSRFLNSKRVNDINWGESDESGLIFGTEGAEWVVTGALDQVLTDSNLFARQFSSFGNADEEVIRVGKSLLTVANSRLKIREIKFTDNRGGFNTQNIALLSDHLFKPSLDTGFSLIIIPTSQGIVEIAYQPDPYPRLWIPIDTGPLISALTISNEEVSIFGSCRIQLGGNARTGDAPRIVSAAVIPSPDKTRSEVWFLVIRFVDGGTRQYIEYLTPEFEVNTPLEDAIFLDSSLTLDDPKQVFSATQANPVVISTGLPHGFSNGNEVIFENVQGMTELNDLPATQIDNVTSLTFELQGVDGTDFGETIPVDRAGVNKVRKLVNTITGLSHLEGETIQVVGDGLVQKDQTVVSGSITLETKAARVHVGYKYNSDCRLLNFDAGSATGTALGKSQRTNRVGLSLDRTVDVKVGRDFTTMFSARPGKTDLFTGILTVPTNVDYQLGNKICLRQDSPLPGTILAVMPGLTTQDR